MNFKKVYVSVMILILAIIFVPNYNQVTNANTTNQLSSISAQGKPSVNPITIESVTDTTLLGEWDENYGQPQDVEVVDDIAYIASYYGGLVTMNVSTPSNPIILDYYDFDYPARALKVVDDIAYVAFSQWGTCIFNVSDPSNIVFLYKFLLGGIHYDPV